MENRAFVVTVCQYANTYNSAQESGRLWFKCQFHVGWDCSIVLSMTAVYFADCYNLLWMILFLLPSFFILLSFNIPEKWMHSAINWFGLMCQRAFWKSIFSLKITIDLNFARFNGPNLTLNLLTIDDDKENCLLLDANVCMDVNVNVFKIDFQESRISGCILLW